MSGKKAKDTPKIHQSKISFDDVVGHKQVKERLRAIIKIIKNPKRVEEFDIPAPKGVLIYGPISVGKIMLAKAFSKEAGLSYLEISGSKLFELDYIKEVYETASKHAPCIVILEDIDIKGIMQGAITNVSFSDIGKVLESVDTPVFTIATAETLDGVDPILMAPEKLDFLIEVSKLDKDARKFFIEKIVNFTAACRAEFFDKSEHHLFVMRFVKCPIPDVINLSMRCFGNAGGHKKIRPAAFDKFKPF